MIQYLAVRQQGGQYTPLGQPHDERAAALSAGYDEAGSPDFYVATLTDGRVIAYGWGITDFEPGSHDLAEIEKQIQVGE
jgi:hypothetical protein